MIRQYRDVQKCNPATLEALSIDHIPPSIGKGHREKEAMQRETTQSVIFTVYEWFSEIVSFKKRKSWIIFFMLVL